MTSVVVDAAHASPWAQVLTALKLKPTAVGGVLLHRVPPIWSA